MTAAVADTIMHPGIDNYLRTFRKRSGLTQREVAFLLSGGGDGSMVSRYEQRVRRPDLQTAFAYQIMYGPSADALMPGAFAVVEQIVIDRAHLLAGQLQAEPEGRRLRRKLQFLAALVSRGT